MKKELSRMLSVALLLTLSCVFTACPSDTDPEEDFTQEGNNKGNYQGDNNGNNGNNNNQSGKSYKGTINGHEYVDLGLPSGTKWATCNVGASKPEEYGGYYAWGETTTKSEYYWRTYKYGKSESNLVNIGSDIANTNYDVAYVKWGAPWCMPTFNQLLELFDNTTREWTTMNGVNGMRLTGKNGGTLFFPASGHWMFSYLNDVKSSGYYFSSSLDAYDEAQAQRIYIYNDGTNFGYGSGHDFRCYGYSVRPVTMSSENSSYNGSSPQSGEAPSFRDFTWTYTNTSVTVQYLTTQNNTTKATVYYGKNTSPSTSVSTTVSGGHIISARITGLTKATKYYVKCVATNEYGSTTSNVMPVMTGSD